MASPHVPADLMQPAGMLTLALFPGYADQAALDAFLQPLLDAGYENAAGLDTQAQRDEAALQWAYHVAYRAVWQRMSATPLTASIDGEGSRGFATTQIAAFLKLSNDALGAYESLIAGSETTVRVVSSRVQNRFVW